MSGSRGSFDEEEKRLISENSDELEDEKPENSDNYSQIENTEEKEDSRDQNNESMEMELSEINPSSAFPTNELEKIYSDIQHTFNLMQTQQISSSNSKENQKQLETRKKHTESLLNSLNSVMKKIKKINEDNNNEEKKNEEKQEETQLEKLQKNCERLHQQLQIALLNPASHPTRFGYFTGLCEEMNEQKFLEWRKNIAAPINNSIIKIDGSSINTKEIEIYAEDKYRVYQGTEESPASTFYEHSWVDKKTQEKHFTLEVLDLPAAISPKHYLKEFLKKNNAQVPHPQFDLSVPLDDATFNALASDLSSTLTEQNVAYFLRKNKITLPSWFREKHTDSMSREFIKNMNEEIQKKCFEEVPLKQRFLEKIRINEKKLPIPTQTVFEQASIILNTLRSNNNPPFYINEANNESLIIAMHYLIKNHKLEKEIIISDTIRQKFSVLNNFPNESVNLSYSLYHTDLAVSHKIAKIKEAASIEKSPIPRRFS